MIVGLWFEKKRGSATGITVAGTGVGLFVLPPFCTLMIDLWGWRNSMYGLAALVFLCFPLALLYRDVPSTYTNGQKKLKVAKKPAKTSIEVVDVDANSVGVVSSRGSINEELEEEPTCEGGAGVYVKRGSSASVAKARAANTLLRQAVCKKKNGICQSMTAVNYQGQESLSGHRHAARTLEDLTDRTLDDLQGREDDMSITETGEPETKVRNRTRPSYGSHLSVSNMEPLRKKDLFYSVSTINLSLENPANGQAANGGRSGQAGEGEESACCREDGKLHKRLHHNKFVNGLMSMLGFDIFKDRCFILLLFASVVTFMGSFLRRLNHF